MTKDLEPKETKNTRLILNRKNLKLTPDKLNE